MANWKVLTDVHGQLVHVNLDAILDMRRYSEQVYTDLRAGFIPDFTISVRETPEEIYSRPSQKSL